jgi:hypothetical protein
MVGDVKTSNPANNDKSALLVFLRNTGILGCAWGEKWEVVRISDIVVAASMRERERIRCTITDILLLLIHTLQSLSTLVDLTKSTAHSGESGHVNIVGLYIITDPQVISCPKYMPYTDGYYLVRCDAL